MPRHLMAVAKITINDVLGILNAINKSISRNIASVAHKELNFCSKREILATAN
jgi:hypothetical protein